MTDTTEKNTPNTEDTTYKLLHDLAHQAMEIKGVKALSIECTPLLTLVLIMIRESELSHAQMYGVLLSLPQLLSRTMCDRCKDMGTRIADDMVTEYSHFVQAHVDRMKKS